MKRLAYVGDVTLTELEGEPALDEKTGKPVVMSHFRFMMQRLADPKFASTKEQGLEAMMFVIETRTEITQQQVKAASRGYWLLEDDRAKAMQESTLRPSGGYNPRTQHNFISFAMAAKNMTDDAAETAKEKEKVNGTTSVAVPAPEAAPAAGE
jgi:hypothetical protein